MTTINAPYSQGQTEGDLGYDYIFAAERIRMELQDKLNVLALGVVPLVGNLAGSGSDTVRVTRMGNVGFARRFASMSSEDATISASTLTTGYDSVTIGQKGLAEEETYKHQMLTRERGLTLEQLQAEVPNSWLATWRYDLCVAGAAITDGDVGSAAAVADKDDVLDLVAEYDQTLGSGDAGLPVNLVSPTTWTRISQSMAGLAAFQNRVEDYEGLVARNPRQDKGVRMGMRWLVTDDIQQSGGAFVNVSFEPGAFGWAVADTSPIDPANPSQAIYVPEFGMLIERIGGTGNRGVKRHEARTWYGIAKGNANLAVARRFLDKVTP